MTGDMVVTGGLRELRQAVLGTEVCSACGACVGLCPYIKCVEDRVAAVAECRKSEGRCFLFCPRAHGPELTEFVGQPGKLTHGLGSYRRLLEGRSLSPSLQRYAQHGGVVSALLVHALREGLIEAAVLTRRAQGRPEPFLARSEEEVLSAAGSTFAAAPTVAEVNRVMVDEGLAGVPLGVVALPCQAAALARMRRAGELRDTLTAASGSSAEKPGSEEAVPHVPDWLDRPFPSIALVIGLFCTWALSQAGWRRLLREAGVGTERGSDTGAGSGDVPGASTLVRAEIPPPPANVLEFTLADGVVRTVPLDEVRPHIRPGCLLCADMTSEAADVSVGLVEGREGWNTIISRTEVGDSLVRGAEEAALIRIEPLQGERAEHLSGASQGKKARARDRARERGLELPYLSEDAGRPAAEERREHG